MSAEPQIARRAKQRGSASVQNIGVAVVGTGYWGKNLVRVFAALGALRGIVDPDEQIAGPIASAHGCPVMDYATALADPSVDAIAIATPAALHSQHARRALDAGKHVFVEKPLALEVDQALELCEIAERRDRRLMVGHLLQYHPAFLELVRIVRGGRLGRLQYLYSNRLNLGKIRREEDVLWSFAPHDISMILAIVGAEPTVVDAIGSYHLHETIADVATAHLEFPGGERAHVFVSWLHPFKEQRLVVVGSDAMAVFDDAEPWENKLALYPHKIARESTIPSLAKGERISIALTQDEPLKQECEHFLDCVRSGAAPRTDGREGLRVLGVLARARLVLQTKAKAMRPLPPGRTSHTFGPDVSIHESAYVDDNVVIGEGTKIWHFCHVLTGVRIGRNTSVGQNVVIGPRVSVGSNVKIQNNVSVYEGVTLEDGVFCGPSCVFTNVNNPRAEIVRKSESRATLVKRGATIGANATIVCGHTLGEYCFVAAGAVVTDDVPAFALVAGVPARRIGWMSRAGQRLGPDLICPQTGARYRELDTGVLEEI